MSLLRIMVPTSLGDVATTWPRGLIEPQRLAELTTFGTTQPVDSLNLTRMMRLTTPARRASTLRHVSASRRVLSSSSISTGPFKTVILNEGGSGANISLEEDILRGTSSVSVYERCTHEAEGAHGIISWRVPALGKAELDRLTSAVVISRVGVGVDSVDIKYAGELGIKVTNIPAYGTEEVADTAMAHILNKYRRFSIAVKGVETNAVTTSANTSTQKLCGGARRIRGERLGLIGFGRIGTAVARRAQTFGFEIGFFDPYVADGVDRSFGGATRYRTVEQLVEESDCISLHCTHTDETSKILNRELLTSKIKPGCIVINTARQGLIDDHALGDAIRAGRIDSAGLDCLASEPKLTHPFCVDEDGPFHACGDRVTVTPHCSFFSGASILDMKSMSAREVNKVLQSGTSNNIVNNAWLNLERANSRWEQAMANVAYHP